MFFVAVLLVILGTYCLFTAGSIALLKIMRKNKTYFYKTKHFISVSGMIYRMKQNAVGLANICILSTMVLVMVSGTISLYLGIDDIISTQYPRDIAIAGYGSLTDGQKSDLKGMFQQAAEESGQSVEGMVEYTTLDISVWKSGGNMVIANPEDGQPEGTLCVLEILTLEEYNRVAKEPGQLQDDEIFV